MAPKEIILPSNAKLTIHLVDFELAEKLHDAFLIAVQQKGIDFNLDIGDVDTESIKSVGDLSSVVSQNSKLISAIIDKVIQIMTSKELKVVMYDCMLRSLYNGEKITKKIFEPVEARPDYYHVCYHILMENLSPFFSTIGSLLKGGQSPTGKSTLATK